eukprot:2275381-Amphidinium_carterae.1
MPDVHHEEKLRGALQGLNSWASTPTWAQEESGCALQGAEARTVDILHAASGHNAQGDVTKFRSSNNGRLFMCGS